MKSLLISVVLFAILLTCIFINVGFIHRTAETLRDMLTRLDQVHQRAEILTELEQYWESQKKLISLSVGFRELDHFGETLVGIRWAYEEGDEKEFRRYQALLLDAIEEISRIERFSIENLF